VAVIVADTDVLIDALRGKGAHRRVRLEIGSGRLATTVISVFELWSGARGAAEQDKIGRLFGALRILDLDEMSAREASAIRRDLESKGTPIGTADYLIAAICMVSGAILLTRNREHFERVPGLTLAPGG
jgi:tRNA(fMet)-specific endonuclease VapC